MELSKYLSLITLNANVITTNQRHRLAEWIQNQGPYISYLKEKQFIPKDTYRPKVRGWKKVLHVNGNQRKVGLAILILHKVDFKIKLQNIEKDIT